MTAKDQARSRIAAAAEELLELSHRVHAHPETAAHCAGPAADRAVLDGAVALAAAAIDAATRDDVRQRLLNASTKPN